MQKGENAISIALTALMVLLVLGFQRRWNASMLTDMASSAEDFVLETAGLKGQIPELPGHERVRTFWLGRYRAALYRASPAPLVFASYRFIIYDRNDKPVFNAASLEASAKPWTTLYDFAGTRGLPDLRKPGGPGYTRDLTGDGAPDILLGQYSGGDHCCTTVTVIELGQSTVKVLGKIGGLDGLPFDGIEVRRLGGQRGKQLVAHRPYRTVCGSPTDAADILAIYTYANGKFIDQTNQFANFVDRILQDNLNRWKQPKNRSLRLLQTVATNYSQAGKPADADEFFQQNLPSFLPQLKSSGVNPQACTQDLSNLVNRISPGKS